MAWIRIFAMLFIIAFIVLTVIDNERMKEKKRYNTDQSLTDEEIRKNVRNETRSIKMIIYGGLIAVIVVGALFSSMFFTTEQEIGYVNTFGNVAVVEGSGLHFKIPFISTKEVFDATNKGMAIGYDIETNESLYEESLMITSDFNFVNTDFYVEYRISDPIDYDFGSNDPEGILRNVAQASIRNTVGLYDVDAVLTTGRSEIEAIVKSQIIEKLQHHETGLTIVSVSIQDVEPPTSEVIDAFNAVETAKQDAETAVNEAKKKEQTRIPEAEAEADKIIKTADAYKTERINQATQEVAEFTALYNEYLQNPETVKRQLYYSAMQEILPGMEIIIGNDAKVIYVQNGELVSSTAN